MKSRRHSLLVFDGIRSEDGSDAGDALSSSIFAIARGKDGLPLEMISHGGNDDKRKQVRGCKEAFKLQEVVLSILET